MLHSPKWVLMALMLMMSACFPGWNPTLAGGGGMPQLTLPFASGEYWLLTQGYGDQNIFGSHEDWGSPYYDDSYAVDFSQPGCQPYDKPVYPVARGVVMEVVRDASYGNSVLVDHGNDYVSRYAHLHEVFVEEDQEVSTREMLGTVGNTGNVVGQACPSHPGTHLHLAFYRNGNGMPPVPLSGQNSLHLGCWYNREGNEVCRADQPSNYDAEDWENEDEEEPEEEEEDEPEDDREEDDGEMDIRMLAVSPERGVVSETHFVWTTVIEGDEPDEVTLMIYNENDDEVYEFEMQGHSQESPWVYSYRKSLRDSTTYTYWVEVDGPNGRIESNEEEVEVEEEDYFFLEYEYFTENPEHGDVDETFEWEALFEAEGEPDMELMILNPNDAEIYSFGMSVDEFGNDAYLGEYSKTLRDNTTYIYWVEARLEDAVENSDVFAVEVD